eukprot:9245885-Pyramimonas_sp.AAC.1
MGGPASPSMTRLPGAASKCRLVCGCVDRPLERASTYVLQPHSRATLRKPKVPPLSSPIHTPESH